jgi:hypothetical protein
MPYCIRVLGAATLLTLGAGAMSAQTPVQRTSASPAAAAAQSGDTAASAAVSERGGRSELSIDREVFTYSSDGRRDPFRSLMSSADLRPMISDLELKAVIYDPSGGSVAIMRDVTTKEQYRVRVGQALGRMRVARIQPRSITFTIDEFGINRQEVLTLNDPTKARTQ